MISRVLRGKSSLSGHSVFAQIRPPSRTTAVLVATPKVAVFRGPPANFLK
jgi:hypothetical protein